jgi:hypothetical protein
MHAKGFEEAGYLGDTETDSEVGEDGAAFLKVGLDDGAQGCNLTHRAACTTRVSRVPRQREKPFKKNSACQVRAGGNKDGAVAVHAQPLIAGFSLDPLSTLFCTTSPAGDWLGLTETSFIFASPLG